MLSFLKQTSIRQITFLFIIFAGIFAFIFALLVIFNEKRELKQDIEKAKNEYIQNKKNILISQTSKMYNMIEYYSSYHTQNELKTHVSDIISSVYSDSLEMTYPFIFDKNGLVIYSPKLTKNKDINLSKFQTKTKDNLLSKIQNLAKNGGGFINFQGISDKNNQKIKNLIYTIKMNKLGWIIGSGIYLNDFNNVIEAKKTQSSHKITSFILKILTLTFALYIVSIMKYKLLTKRISKEIQIIDNSFREASKFYTFIDESKIQLDEFKKIAHNANSMIKTIKENTLKLQTLNANLEKIIEEKTAKLQESAHFATRLLKDQDKFINNAIHEINTPLSVIMMNTEFYHLKYEKNPYLEKIEAAVKVLENINQDLSYVAKKDLIIYKKQMLDFSAFLKKRVEYFEDIACQSELSFTCTIQDNINVYFNEVELSRILDNNISNSIKYSYPNTVIAIVLKKQGLKAIFSIKNKSEKIQNTTNLFDRYYRENNSRGGFGLGLNIVREICEKNNVSIDIKSHDGYNVFTYEFFIKE